MTIRATKDRPLYTAVVGGGPSGFYVADAVQRAGVYARIDLFDRLPTPSGAQPDPARPDPRPVRPVLRVHEKIAGRPGFRFLGNVTVGRDLTMDEMRAHYDAIILCIDHEDCCRLVEGGRSSPGLYAAGSGESASGTDRSGSARAVSSLLADMPHLRPCVAPGPEAVDAALAGRGVEVVDFASWRRIDAETQRPNPGKGQPRPEASTVDELLRLRR